VLIGRRTFVSGLLASGLVLAPISQAQKPLSPDTPLPEDWVCPMHPDVHSDKPGVCPRCGMALLLHVPDWVEYHVQMSHSPSLLNPGTNAIITLRVLDPETSKPIEHFELVHEKLMHVFLVSENLEFFAHLHPTPEADGSFRLQVRLPQAGMYRLLADYYPSGSVPQLTLKTLFVSGSSQTAQLRPAPGPSRANNLTASLRFDPEQPLAGLETKLFFELDPANGLEPYLGAWGHMLMASADLIDLIHVHPLRANGGPIVQFNVIFPRPGFYRIWAQFQRSGMVNTVEFTVPVKAI